uniref:NAD(P)H dehydrogenase, quinone 1 n=1 Tax=Labrus bergylta TaxID=56723 RepID=A0A3Q3FL98_9LABR
SSGKKGIYIYILSCSFNAAAKEVAVEILSAQGWTVEVSELYALKFEATVTTQDIIGEVKNADHFRYAEETKLAWEAGKLSDDITGEQRELTEANLIIIQFPMYWFTVPAIMKGWMDRVLTLGYAYSQEKRSMLSFTTGSHESMFSANGINGDINVTLWPLQNGILHYCGFQVLGPQIFWALSHIPTEARGTMLEGWRKRLQVVEPQVCCSLELHFPGNENRDLWMQ